MGAAVALLTRAGPVAGWFTIDVTLVYPNRQIWVQQLFPREVDYILSSKI